MADLKRPPLPRDLWLIKRGPGYGEHFHESLVPDSVHPVVICTRKYMADWEAGWTGDGATVWVHPASTGGGGWLMTRWNGFDIDYGHVVRGLDLPDGTRAGISHDGEPRSLLDGAVWWSPSRMPEWVSDSGVRYPTDKRSRGRIVGLAGDCVLSESRKQKERDYWAQFAAPWEVE